MSSFVSKNHRVLFYTSWVVINILQAFTTELFDDEAYYWVYSRFLDWGYFDHPPMIALFIKAGYLIFKNELGVRLLVVLCSTATLIIIQKLLKRNNDHLFYAIALSIAILQIGGIIAVPDTPLMFFVSLFFLIYKQFTTKMTLVNTLFLGVVISLMLYSKYHAILIVLFTLMSNPALLTKYQTYFAAVIALVLFSPHLYWQYVNDFPSVQYQLFERNPGKYRITYTLEYFLVQIVLAGPLIGWLLLYAAFRFKPISKLERALQFCLAGFYLFFFLSTFLGRVEANWTVPAFVALIVLSHQYLVDRTYLRNILFRLAPISLLLVIIVRINMFGNGRVVKIPKEEIFGNRAWVSNTSQQAESLPIVFIDSYQKASKYWFYSNQPGFSLNTPLYRRNNFNLWSLENSLFGKKVYASVKYDSLNFPEKVPLDGFELKGYAFVDNYYSFSRVRITDIEDVRVSENLLKLTCTVRSPEDYLLHYQNKPSDSSTFIVAIYKRGRLKKYIYTAIPVKNCKGAISVLTLSAPVNLPPGEYLGRLAISTSIPRHPSLNSPPFSFIVQR